MLRLHYSNRLEELVAPLADKVEERQRADPLARVAVVVPNRVVAEFLKLKLAERLGVAANIEFPFLRAYLARIAREAQEDVHVLEADELRLAVFECLRREIGNGDTALEPVRRYVADAADAVQRELRLFQLSERVARLFREYSIVRPAMLASWRKRKTVAANADFAEAEGWQRALYLALFDKSATLKRDYVDAPGPRWMLIPDALDSIEPASLAKALANPLHVFGLSYVGPEFIRIFGRLGRLTDLHVYALNPCREFWEDIGSASRRLTGAIVRRGEKLGGALDAGLHAALDADEDPFGLATGSDNRALQLWGRPGREYVRLLNELTECDFDAHFVDSALEVSTLLRSLQRAILNREPDAEPRLPGDGAPDDRSIRFLACPGIRREVEIVADAICEMIRENDESRDAEHLRFHQIALAVPDSEVDTYLPHIETVLADQYRIPLNVAAPRFNAESRVGETVRLLLELPGGRLRRDEVLHLLTHPALAGGVADAEPEQWQEWCRQLGIFFGADAQDFDGTYLPADMYNWDQALKRLALGVFMAGEASGVTETFKAEQGSEYLPYETGQSEAPTVAALLRLARGLLSDALRIRESRLGLGEWAELMGGFVATYVCPDDAAGARVLDRCLGALASLDCPELRTGEVSYEVARELALSRVADAQSQQGLYSERGVAVGSLSTLRLIPFRNIFILGLGESSFPERDRRDPVDLRLMRRRAGDVGAAERDRYLFLEALLAARDRIVLSWVSRDAQTGEQLEPSALVRELQFILRGRVDQETLAKKMTVEHPVSRYDLEYFPDLAPSDREHRPELVSFDPFARRGARMKAAREDLGGHCDGAILPGRDSPVVRRLADGIRQKLEATLRTVPLPDRASADAQKHADIVLPIAALRSFLECPVQGAARYALGIVDEDGDADEDHEDEPLKTGSLARTMMLREAFWLGRGVENAVEREYARAFRAGQLRGQAPVGPFAEAAGLADRKKLRLCIEQAAKAGMGALDGWQQIRIGRAREFARVERAIGALALEVEVAAPTGPLKRTVRLCGIVGPVSERLDRSFRCIHGSEARPRHFLDGMLGAIALAAAGEKVPREFVVAALGGEKDGDAAEKFTRSFAVPGRKQARDYLSALVEDLLFGENDYFLPIEAVERVLHPRKSDPEGPSQIVYKVRDEARSQSDYGPLRDARRFDPPDDEEIRRIIGRRFEPIKNAFGK